MKMPGVTHWPAGSGERGDATPGGDNVPRPATRDTPRKVGPQLETAGRLRLQLGYFQPQTARRKRDAAKLSLTESRAGKKLADKHEMFHV